MIACTSTFESVGITARGRIRRRWNSYTPFSLWPRTSHCILGICCRVTQGPRSVLSSRLRRGASRCSPRPSRPCGRDGQRAHRRSRYRWLLFFALSIYEVESILDTLPCRSVHLCRSRFVPEFLWFVFAHRVAPSESFSSCQMV